MKMMKRASLLLALVLLVCSMGIGASAAGKYLGSMQVVNCNSWVTLRLSPSTSAASVCHVPKGAWVEAWSYNSQFTECNYNGMHGYILASFLSGGSNGKYLGMKTIVNCNNWVTLRAAPSTGAATVTKVPLGSQVQAYYYNSTFSYCMYGNLDGYILNSYLGNGGSSSGGNSKYAGYTKGEYMGTCPIVKCNSYVTLRATPSTKAYGLCIVPKGAYVDAWYYNGQFAECSYNGMQGYILLYYIG